MPRKKPSFLVLESYWSEEITQRESVLPFVKGLCDLQSWEFFYRTFDSLNDLGLWLDRFDRIKRSKAEKIVYIATHGSRGGKLWTLEQNIPLVKLGKLLAKAHTLRGLHLGSCNLGQPKHIKALMKDTGLSWVAAYDQEVPWLESTTLDLLFWSWIYAGAPRAERSRYLTPETAAHELYSRFNYARQMGFRVIDRKRKDSALRSSWDTWQPDEC